MRRLVPLLAILAACDGGSPTGNEPPPAGMRAVQVAEGLVGPVYATAPAGDARLFIVEQPGRIRILKNGSLLPRAFLDITDRVGSGGERGLLSVAFHPSYAQNGRFYVNYTDRAGTTRIERYQVSTDPDVATLASASLVLSVEQPFANHNGGHLLFGPDGYLYIPLGDGGSGGDPLGHGQNPNTLLGALLRLDVNGAAPYAIPVGNPYRNGGGRPEIWGIGLRNPWRIAFDGQTLFVADVGQSAREEVNAVPVSAAGLNYGWNRMEGSRCFAAENCDRTGLTLPVHEYGHDEGCSITGGFVYRGTRIPEARGHYFYSDYCSGFIRSFELRSGAAVDHRDWEIEGLTQVMSFGRDAAGELYVLTASGRVYRLEPGSE